MARIPPPSLLLLPLLLLALASWTPPAADARLLQARDSPQWLEGLEEAPLDEQAPFDVRMRRSPQSTGSGDADQPSGQKPNPFTNFFNKVKDFAKKAIEAFGQLLEAFGCSRRNGGSGGSTGGGATGSGTGDAEVMRADKIRNDDPNES